MESRTLLNPHFIKVIKIKVVSLFIDEFNIPEDVTFKVDFDKTYYVDVNTNLVIINLNIVYSIPIDEQQNRKVLDCIVHNAFEVENIKDFVDEKGVVNLPLDLLSSLVGLSLTHSRAVISIHSAGTALGDTLIPVVNPIDFTKALFEEKK